MLVGGGRCSRSSRSSPSRSCDVSVAAFDTVSVGAFAGSLFGVLVLVAVPVMLLGAVSPWAHPAALRSVDDGRRIAGRLYAISTVGSLVGTFAAALLLIPLVGTQRTFLVFALALALVAAVGLAGAGCGSSRSSSPRCWRPAVGTVKAGRRAAA